MKAPVPAPATDAVVVEQPTQSSGGGLLDGTDETETALTTPGNRCIYRRTASADWKVHNCDRDQADHERNQGKLGRHSRI